MVKLNEHQPLPFSIANIRSVMVLAWRLACGSLPKLILFSLAFKVINFAMLAPLASFTLRVFLQRWGRASVGNFEIAQFLLSPTGLVAICCVGGIVIATLYLEVAGLMQIMLRPTFRWWTLSGRSLRLYQKLLRLGGLQLSVLLAIALPFVGLVGLVYAMLWKGRDLNGLIILQPPEFWLGVGLAGTLLCIFGIAALFLILRWFVALPILLCEPFVSPIRALRKSQELTRSSLWMIIACLVVWFATQTVLATCTLAATYVGIANMLDVPWQTLSTAALVTGVSLSLEWLLGTFFSVAGNIGFAALALSLYRALSAGVGEASGSNACSDIAMQEEAASEGVAPESNAAMVAELNAASYRFSRLLVAIAILVLGVAIGVAYWICDTLVLKEPVSITAHRAGAAFAPENTIAALVKAIEDRADWAEIDVQLTADQELVVMHDTDLARVGGGNKSVAKATLAEIQSLDVGSLFAAQFAGERIPRFSDLLVAAKDKIRLNVELKPHGAADADELARRVVDEIRAVGMLAQCRICSQSYASLQLAKTLESKIEVGFIVATAIGDSTQLDVNFLMLSQSKVTRPTVERARSRGIEIHAWTVNDPATVLKLIDAGVANIITDDAVKIAEQLKAIESLRPVERILLRAKNGMR